MIDNAAPPAPPSQIAWVRRLLCGLLTTDRIDSDCAGAIAALGVIWLQQQHLAPLAWVRCRQSPLLSPETLDALHHTYLTAVADAELHGDELTGALQALAAQDIIPVVFKGAALAYTVYPDAACRPMGDLDLWIAGDDMPRAQAALEAIGYRLASNPDRPFALMKQFKGEIGLYHARADLGLIELHWSIFLGEWLRLAANVDEEAIRSRLRSATLLDQRVQLLAPEDALLQLVVHVAINHQFSLAVLRSFIDMALVARAQPLNWQAVADRARAWRLATVTWLTLTLAADLAGLEETRPILLPLAPSRLRQRLLGRFVCVEPIVAQEDLRLSRWRFVMLLLLIDRVRDAFKLIARALWPERDWLQARYGRVSHSIRVKHVLAALRGRI